MKQSVLDGVVAIEAKAAGVVAEAKTRARQVRDQVKVDLERLAQELEREGKAEIETHAAAAEARKAAAQRKLDDQLRAALGALEKVKTERTGPLTEELTRLLEQRADGD